MKKIVVLLLVLVLFVASCSPNQKEEKLGKNVYEEAILKARHSLADLSTGKTNYDEVKKLYEQTFDGFDSDGFKERVVVVSFLITIDTIKEIADCEHFTKVPMMPDEFLGITNIRGHIISVIDGASRLELGTINRNKQMSLIITNVNYDTQEVMMAMGVEEIGEVVEVEREKIQNVPSFGARRSPFIVEYARLYNNFVPLVDVRKLLFFESI